MVDVIRAERAAIIAEAMCRREHGEKVCAKCYAEADRIVAMRLDVPKAREPVALELFPKGVTNE